mmetsp:Transcript_22235/g.68512  ORF Transcript_22235/g.68512 Transcript_22235/m.68512 type:complete len:227 (-) Transcript_22235:1370-2050(-)
MFIVHHIGAEACVIPRSDHSQRLDAASLGTGAAMVVAGVELLPRRHELGVQVRVVLGEGRRVLREADEDRGDGAGDGGHGEQAQHEADEETNERHGAGIGSVHARALTIAIGDAAANHAHEDAAEQEDVVKEVVIDDDREAALLEEGPDRPTGGAEVVAIDANVAEGVAVEDLEERFEDPQHAVQDARQGRANILVVARGPDDLPSRLDNGDEQRAEGDGAEGRGE